MSHPTLETWWFNILGTTWTVITENTKYILDLDYPFRPAENEQRGHFSQTSFPGSYLLWRKHPGESW
jgi:hypothetical protein